MEELIDKQDLQGHNGDIHDPHATIGKAATSQRRRHSGSFGGEALT